MNTGKQLSDYEEVLLPKDIMEILHISRSTVVTHTESQRGI